MKLSKKMMAINVLVTILMTDVAMAGRISGERKSSTSSQGSRQSSSPTSSKTTEAPKSDFQVVQTADMTTCSMDVDKEKYFPLELFSQLARDDGAAVDIQVRPNNKIVVKIPPVINVCGHFTPEIRQDNITKNVTVLIKMIGTRKIESETNGKKVTTEVKDVLLTHKELEDCLVEKGIMVNGKIEYDKVKGSQYSESVSAFDYDFVKSEDVKKTVTVSYGYPKAYVSSSDGYPPLFGFENRTPTVPGESCMRSEKIAEETVYINEGRDVLIEKINAACLSGDAQKIADARKSLGNADALKDIAAKIGSELDAAYLATVKSDVDRISADMTKIEDNLSRNRDTMDEAKAKREVAKYAELTKELNSKFLNPAIYRLDTLMQKRAGIDDDESPELKSIDEEITKLNEDIGKFSKRNATSFNTLYSTMEKYALTDSAKTIEEVRLKSSLYAQVRATKSSDGKSPLTFEAASQKQNNLIQKFEKNLNIWTDVYLVGKGNMFPIQRTERERQGAIDRMNSRYAAFERQEITDYNKYCTAGIMGGMKNPVRCSQFVNGREKRMNLQLRKREKDLVYIKEKNETLARMAVSYNEYQKDLASKEEQESNDFDPTGGTYTGYEDNFSERFPGYFGPTSSTAYNPSLFNLGGVSGSVNMGQSQMNMAQQQQFSGQPGYQHQMNSWLSLN